MEQRSGAVEELVSCEAPSPSAACSRLRRRPYPKLDGAGAARLRDGEARVVVVGAGGWLGLATLELLHGLFGAGFVSRVACFGSDDRRLLLRGGFAVEQRSLARLAGLPARPSLVLHLAFLTQEKARTMPTPDYVAANRAISKRVLEALGKVGADRLFLPSSGAVYGVDDGVEASKQIYGRLKLEDEARFARWAVETGGKAVTARVFNLSGPYINKQASYALAAFVADVLARRPIRIAATRPVYRSYVAIAELMSVVMGCLTSDAEPPPPFDTASEDVYEMSTMAEAVASALGHDLGYERPPSHDGEIDRYVGEGSTFARLRDRFGVAPIAFADQVRDTAAFMAALPRNAR